MHFQKQSSVRLELEALEDRALPNNFFGPNLLNGNSQQSSDQLFAAASSAAATGNLGNPGILPPQSNAYGASYGQWSAAWWQYAYSLDADHSPWLDGTGHNFADGQSGKVWFLAGSFNSYNPVTGDVTGPASFDQPAIVSRTVTVPNGKALFFPIVNSEWDNYNPSGPDNTLTVDQMRTNAATTTKSVVGMNLTIDGVKVNNLTAYRTLSPVFSYGLPNNDIYGEAGAPKESTVPAVGDGYYVMVAPLSAGQHTINFTGGFPGSNDGGPAVNGPTGYGENITYHITVGK